MTRFLGDGIGSRDGKGKIDRRRDLEEFKRTGRHPEIEAAASASAAAAMASAPLPLRDPERRHVFLDLSVPSSTSDSSLDVTRLVVEVFDDVDRAAGGALLSRCDGSGGAGSSGSTSAVGLLGLSSSSAASSGSLAGARLSRAAPGQGLFFSSPPTRGGGEGLTMPSSSSAAAAAANPALHHTEAGAVSLSRAAVRGGLNGGAAGGSPGFLAVLFHACGPLDSTHAVAGRVVPQCRPSLEKIEQMAREDYEKMTARRRRKSLLSSVEVVAAGRATPKQACSMTSAELDAEATRDSLARREAAIAARSPAAAAARAEAEAAAARGAVEEALAVAEAEEEERRKRKEREEEGSDDGKTAGAAAAQASKKRQKKKKKKKGGMMDSVLG